MQSIYVSEPQKDNGQKIFDIEIRYKFQSPFATERRPEQAPLENEHDAGSFPAPTSASEETKKEDISSANEISSEKRKAVSA